MIRFRKLGNNVRYCLPWLGFLALSLLAGLWLPGKGWAQLRDVEFIRQNAAPYVARALKDLEADEKGLDQRKGDQGALLIRLSRACYLLGELAEDRQRLAYYEKGQNFAEILVKEQPARVEGQYWLASHLCGVAEVGGAGRALGLLPEIVEILDKAASMDPVYDQAGAHRALGSIFCEAPAWPISVGDLNKSLHHLTLAVRIAPENSTNQLFLGYTLMQLGRKPEAHVALNQVFKSTRHSVWPPGVEHDRREARRLLKQLKKLDTVRRKN